MRVQERANPHPSVLQVSTADWAGGAERVAWNLFTGLRAARDSAQMAVGYRRSDDPDVFMISPDGGIRWERFWNGVADSILTHFGGRLRGAGRASLYARRMAAPRALGDWWRGRENFRFPGTHDLLDRARPRPDLIHAHNLHGEYFDLRALPALSQRVPVLLTLHDTWTLTGHCSYTLDCQRWESGCGHCPYLDTYPPVRTDATAHNWQTKRDIWARTRLWVSTPSRWLMEKVERSILAPAIVESRVIPNGVDAAVYRPDDQAAARASLGLSPDVAVVTFVGNRFLARNSWKDFATVREAVRRASKRFGREIHLFAVGDGSGTTHDGLATVHLVGHLQDPAAGARYLQAADVHLHAAQEEAENFPNVVLEALSCGVPVVATAIGGIPEQVEGFYDGSDPALRSLNGANAPDGTGILVPPHDPERMCEALLILLENPGLRRALSANAAARASERYRLDHQVETYRLWYREILAAFHGQAVC